MSPKRNRLVSYGALFEKKNLHDKNPDLVARRSDAYQRHFAPTHALPKTQLTFYRKQNQGIIFLSMPERRMGVVAKKLRNFFDRHMRH